VEAELRAKYPGLKIEPVKGGGIFQVKCNDKLIYSKQTVGRFRKTGEVTQLIQEKSRNGSCVLVDSLHEYLLATFGISSSAPEGVWSPIPITPSAQSTAFR